MNYKALPLEDRAAYHEAGHIVMALEQKIEIKEVRLAAGRGDRHATRFAELGKLYDLRSANQRELRFAVRRYIRFLLAGPAALVARLERHYGLNSESNGFAHFRKNLLSSMICKGDADIDLAYSLIFGWFRPETAEDAERMFQEFWARALEAYEYQALWKQVENVAGRLMNSEFDFPEELSERNVQ